MRLLKLELKRVLKTRTTAVLLLAILVISAFMAYIPITFSYVIRWNGQGERETILGMDAIRYDKQARAGLAGANPPRAEICRPAALARTVARGRARQGAGGPPVAQAPCASRRALSRASIARLTGRPQ